MGKEKVIAYTDGGCSVNPGGSGAYGVVILENGQKREYSQGFRSTTNNRMEIMGVLCALENTIGDITIYSDSQYTINTAKGIWRGDKNPDLWDKYRNLAKNRNIEFIWVRGHNGNKYNELCDEICTRTMKEGNLLEDEGYTNPKPRNTENNSFPAKGGAMGVSISIPDRLNKGPEMLSEKEYVKRYNVHLSCAKTILRFYKQERHAFKHYMELKTGGRDGWSNKTLEFMKETVGDEAVEIIKHYLTYEKHAVTALRWCCRGLAVKDAIRKVLVDDEVSRNCMGII